MGKENLRSMGSVDNSGGLELQFKQLPPLSESPIPFSVSSDPHKRLRLSEEVSVLLQKAAIEQVPTSSLGPGFYSRLFLVSKKKGGNETSYRPGGPSGLLYSQEFGQHRSI